MPRNTRPGPVGVVLVHGIGQQKPGAGVATFLKALRRRYGDLAVHQQRTAITVELPDCVLHIYEAYWADVLSGPAIAGTFRSVQLHMLAWFPWLNLRTRLYPSRSRLLSLLPIRVLFWTCLFPPIALGAQLLVGVARVVSFGLGRAQYFDTALDGVPGDVFNYTDSAAGALPPDSPLCGLAASVDERVVAALTAAHEDGCTQVAVVAHSLGTVIAMRTLFGASGATTPRVQHLYTIGSPLRTFGLIWPQLFSSPSPNSHAGLEWHNFWNPLDVISSRLPRVAGWPEPCNHLLIGRAGLASAHITYQEHPRFMKEFAQGIGIKPPKMRIDLGVRVLLALRSVLESVAVVSSLCLAFLVGVAGCVIIAFVLTVIFAAVGTEHLTPEQMQDFLSHLGVIVLSMGGSILVIGFVIGPLAHGRYVAALHHYEYRFGSPLPASPPEEHKFLLESWFVNPRRWWNRRHAGLKAASLFVVVGLVVGWLLVSDGRVEHWVHGLGAGHTIAVVLTVGIGSILGMLAEGGTLFVGTMFGGLCVLLFETYLHYRRDIRHAMQPSSTP